MSAEAKVRSLEHDLVAEAQGQRRADVLGRLVTRFDQATASRGTNWSPGEYEAYNRAKWIIKEATHA